jgi:hypothetical protein
MLVFFKIISIRPFTFNIETIYVAFVASQML